MPEIEITINIDPGTVRFTVEHPLVEEATAAAAWFMMRYDNHAQQNRMKSVHKVQLREQTGDATN